MQDRIIKETVSEKQVLKRLNWLRGLFAILIVIGHCSMEFEHEILPLYVIHKSDMISVSFFFILSGWGLSYNYQHRTDYLKGFILNKPVKLLLIALICGIVDLLVSRCVGANNITWKSIFTFNWYVYEMIYYYLVFYIAYRFIRNKRLRLICVLAFSLLCSIITVMLSNKYNTFWTHAFHFSSFGFVWGIILHDYYDVFKVAGNMTNRWRSSILLVLLAMGGCVCMVMPSGSFIGGCLLHNLVANCVITLLAIWAYYVDYTKMPIVQYLTNISAEIYLYQFTVLRALKECYAKMNHTIDLTYVFWVLLFTILLAVIMHKLNSIVLKHIPGMHIRTEGKQM